MDRAGTKSRDFQLLGHISDMPRQPDDVRSPRILLQKSFWGGERKYLEPLMPFAHGDVRDHIG